MKETAWCLVELGVALVILCGPYLLVSWWLRRLNFPDDERFGTAENELAYWRDFDSYHQKRSREIQSHWNDADYWRSCGLAKWDEKAGPEPKEIDYFVNYSKKRAGRTKPGHRDR